MDATLSREERMRSKRRLERLFKDGKGGFVYPIRYTCLVDKDNMATADPSRPACVLFSVPKKFHKRANKRNLLRRRMREAYRLNKGMLAEGSVVGVDLALVYSVKDIAEYKRIEHALRKIISQIVESL